MHCCFCRRLCFQRFSAFLYFFRHFSTDFWAKFYTFPRIFSDIFPRIFSDIFSDIFPRIFSGISAANNFYCTKLRNPHFCSIELSSRIYLRTINHARTCIAWRKLSPAIILSISSAVRRATFRYSASSRLCPLTFRQFRARKI